MVYIYIIQLEKGKFYVGKSITYPSFKLDSHFNPFNRKCYYIDYIVYLICYHKFHFLTFLLSCMLTRNK